MFDDETTAMLKTQQKAPEQPINDNGGKGNCCYGKIINSLDLQADLDNGVFCDFCREYFEHDIQFCIDEGF